MYLFLKQGFDLESKVFLYFITFVQLRELLRQICFRTGNNHIFQSKHRLITPRSLENFMRMANRKFQTNHQDRQPKPLPDVLVTGFYKFKKILLEDLRIQDHSRYRWGSPESGAPEYDAHRAELANQLQPGEEGDETGGQHGTDPFHPISRNLDILGTDNPHVQTVQVSDPEI